MKLLKSIELNHSVNHVKVLNDDLIAIAIRNEFDIIIYSLNKMEILKIFKAHSLSSVQRLIFLSNDHLLSASNKDKIKLWEIF